MKEIQGDIVNAKTNYIAQQCNCLTVKAHGLSLTLEQAFQHARLYSRRRSFNGKNLAIVDDRAIPGSALILPDVTKKTSDILCIFGQWRPGKPGTGYWNSYPEFSGAIETSEQREVWFRSGLWAFGRYLQSRVTVAFPKKIGCGLAGGQWDNYLKILREFEEEFKELVEIEIWSL